MPRSSRRILSGRGGIAEQVLPAWVPPEAAAIGERVVGAALHERLVQLGTERQPDVELDTGQQREAALLLLGLCGARGLVELVAV